MQEAGVIKEPRYPKRLGQDILAAVPSLHKAKESRAESTKEPPMSAAALPYDFLAPPMSPDELGRLGHYRVLRLLGEGGMGFVFLAEDVKLQRPVALKLMRPDVIGYPGVMDRFLQEARAMAAIRHDHVVTVYQVDEDKGIPYFAMEYLQGQSLFKWQESKPRLLPEQIVRIARETALGLAAAHEHGMIHRDIKPENLWLEEPSGRIKILDFGLAKSLMANVRITGVGLTVGTTPYMSPEQARGETLDGRSDLFSLGSVLYELCTGALPFRADNVIDMLKAIRLREPDPILSRNPRVPPALAQFVTGLLAKDPNDRPPSAQAAADALAAIENELRAPSAAQEPARAPIFRSRWTLMLWVAGYSLFLIVSTIVAIQILEQRGWIRFGPTPVEPQAPQPR
jgi:serine/threonine protein kinase